jgi:hypothetical protein
MVMICSLPIVLEEIYGAIKIHQEAPHFILMGSHLKTGELLDKGQGMKIQLFLMDLMISIVPVL